ncbi:DNA-directed RNA polymerase subunit delta [Thermincola ferriacetica]
MGNTVGLHAQMSEVDLAHAILKAKGQPLYYRELIEQVLEVKPVTGKDLGHIIAGIHTELNLDGRFVHIGQGVWGLREWAPDKGTHIESLDDDYDN